MQLSKTSQYKQHDDMQRSVIVYADYHTFLTTEANENFAFVFKRSTNKL